MAVAAVSNAGTDSTHWITRFGYVNPGLDVDISVCICCVCVVLYVGRRPCELLILNPRSPAECVQDRGTEKVVNAQRKSCKTFNNSANSFLP
jgi:hypothetical protein